MTPLPPLMPLDFIVEHAIGKLLWTLGPQGHFIAVPLVVAVCWAWPQMVKANPAHRFLFMGCLASFFFLVLSLLSFPLSAPPFGLFAITFPVGLLGLSSFLFSYTVTTATLARILEIPFELFTPKPRKIKGRGPHA